MVLTMKEKLLKAQVNGLDISYKISGSGPPLVFLHGWIGHEDTFGLCHEGFAQHFTVYRPAWPGYGGSSPMRRFSIEDFVDIAEHFMETLGLEDVTLIGNCLGGNVAMEFIRTYPERVKQLILVEVHAYFPKYFLPLVIPGINKLLYRIVFKNTLFFNLLNVYMPIQQANVEDNWAYTWEGFERTRVNSALDYLMAIYRFSKKTGKYYRERFRTDIPVLYVEGGESFGPIGAFGELAPIYFKNLKTVSIPEGEHNPVCERPDIFNERVLGALGLVKN
jgi:pimeloyl-ACP methyl ester carboxylesterase